MPSQSLNSLKTNSKLIGKAVNFAAALHDSEAALKRHAAGCILSSSEDSCCYWPVTVVANWCCYSASEWLFIFNLLLTVLFGIYTNTLFGLLFGSNRMRKVQPWLFIFVHFQCTFVCVLFWLHSWTYSKPCWVILQPMMPSSRKLTVQEQRDCSVIGESSTCVSTFTD